MKDIFKDDDTFLARWLNDDLSPEELKAFQQSEEYAMYNQIAEKSGDLEVEAWDKRSIWNEISKAQHSDTNPNKSKTAKTIYIWARWAAAASIILVLGYFTLFNSSDLTTYETLAAEIQTHKLPDGSLVHLNAASRLEFDAEEFFEERLLNLDGEAFFEVEKGAKFTVETKNGDVRVLGTSFNVKSRSDRLDVSCFTGRVGVSFDEFKRQEVLNPGDKVISENQKIIKKIMLTSEMIRPEWKDGSSRFIDSDFKEVINELERQFDIQIESKTSLDELEKYNGGFAHNDLNTALDIVFSAIKYEYTIEGKTVTISRKE